MIVAMVGPAHQHRKLAVPVAVQGSGAGSRILRPVGDAGVEGESL